MVLNSSWTLIFDIAVLAICILLIIDGYKKGFLYKVISCFSIFVVLFLCWQLTPAIADVFHLYPVELAPFADTNLADFFYVYANRALVFALLAIGFLLLLAVLRPLSKLFGKLPLISTINAMFGMIFGLIQSMLVMFLLMFLLETPLFQNGHEFLNASMLNYVRPLGDELIKISGDALMDYQMAQQAADPQDGQTLEELKNWLAEKGLSDQDIAEFILSVIQ